MIVLHQLLPACGAERRPRRRSGVSLLSRPQCVSSVAPTATPSTRPEIAREIRLSRGKPRTQICVVSGTVTLVNLSCASVLRGGTCAADRGPRCGVNTSFFGTKNELNSEGGPGVKGVPSQTRRRSCPLGTREAPPFPAATCRRSSGRSNACLWQWGRYHASAGAIARRAGPE